MHRGLLTTMKRVSAVASATSCATDANANNTQSRALFLLFILFATPFNAAGIFLDRLSLPAVRKAPLRLQCTPLQRTRAAWGHEAHRGWLASSLAAAGTSSTTGHGQPCNTT